MTKKVSAVEARKNLGELLNRVSLMNEEIIIERAGKKIAKIVKIGTENRASASGRLDFRKAAGLGAEVWTSIDVDSYIRAERESWD